MKGVVPDRRIGHIEDGRSPDGADRKKERCKLSNGKISCAPQIVKTFSRSLPLI